MGSFLYVYTWLRAFQYMCIYLSIKNPQIMKTLVVPILSLFGGSTRYQFSYCLHLPPPPPPPPHLQHMCEVRVASAHLSLSPDVSRLVNYIWSEAIDQLEGVLAVSVETVTQEQLDKAEASLLSITRELETDTPSKSFYVPFGNFLNTNFFQFSTKLLVSVESSNHK